MSIRRSLVVAAASIAICTSALAQDKSIIVASTTSTQDSGLFEHILPLFKQKTGIDVKVLAQGTGRALNSGRRGDADVVFVHAKSLEVKFIAEGFGVKRFPIMYNDFVLLCPKRDPAGIKGTRDILAAMKAIKTKGVDFISRADRSGSNIAELNFWSLAGIKIEKDKGHWYKEIGQGLEAALNSAAEFEACMLVDRAAWISFKNKDDLVVTVEGDKRLFNQYAAILVNPAMYPHVKAELGQQFIDWLISPEGQKAIGDYKVDGQQLFFPNANDRGA